jgi:DNA mismatch repair protein MutL
MGKIRILSDNLVSKIAAGEIVERPASVVKELIENSIDAGSKKIDIELESGGKRLIRVSDDGEGMTRDDSLMSIERHATSKIKELNYLFSVSSLGFRGEAIPSIASVSRFRMITRTHDQVIGTVIAVEGGVVRSVEETGAPPGTTVEVRNLFYNTPARHKFMRKTETELSNVIDIVERESLSRPGIGFELLSEGRALLRLPGRETVSERISELYPGIGLHRVQAGAMGVRVSGLMAGPLDTRSTTQKLYTYVNGRGVRDRFLTRMLIDSYGRMIEKGKFPQGVMFIDIPAGDVDVNVHPTKNEVRFGNARLVGDLIRESIAGMLEKAPWLGGRSRGFEHAPGGFVPAREGGAAYGGPGSGDGETGRGVNSFRVYTNEVETSAAHVPTIGREPDRHPEAENRAKGLFGESGFYSGLKVLGQLGDLYIICASPDGMILVDQHAAHERINYERLKKAYTGSGTIHAQDLLVPEVLELSPHESDVLSRYAAELGPLGLHIESFGDNTYIIRRVPALLKNTDLKRLVRDIVSEIKESGAEKSLTDKIDMVISTMACHSSIRANYELGPEKMKALLSELDLAEFPHSCPHGRPVAREISYTDIERMFKRT